MKAKHLLIIIGVCLVIGLLAGYLLRGNPDREKIIEQKIEIENLKTQREDSLKRLQALRDTIFSLHDLLVVQQAEREKERSVAIPDQVTWLNEETIIVNGRKFYGKEKAKNSRRALVGSFGAQAIDEVQIRRKQSENQKAVIATMQGVNLVETKIQAAQQIIIKQLKKETTRKNIQWFLRGTSFGTILALLLVLAI